MASSRSAVSLRSALRIALYRPICSRALHARLATLPRHAPVAYARSFGTVGVRWEKSAAAAADAIPEELKEWDFDMINEISKSNPKNKLLIDVREPNELESTGTIPTSLNIPIVTHPNAFQLPADKFRDLFGFDKPAPEGPGAPELIFYCRAGVRCRAAANHARDAGYTSIADYPGSWLDWAKKGGRTEKYDGSGEIWDER